MQIDKNARRLTPAEIRLAQSVFMSSMPAWSRILIFDGLGIGDRAYTDEDSPLFGLHVGPLVYPDATLSPYNAVFIHELTHVWQFYHGYWVVPRSIYANTIGAGYSYTLSQDDAWDDFNVEHQAQMVEDWFTAGSLATDDRFVFVEKIIRPGITGGFWASPLDLLKMNMPLRKLKNLQSTAVAPSERRAQLLCFCCPADRCGRA